MPPRRWYPIHSSQTGDGDGIAWIDVKHPAVGPVAVHGQIVGAEDRDGHARVHQHSPLVSVIVCPLTEELKSIVSPSMTSTRAWRNEWAAVIYVCHRDGGRAGALHTDHGRAKQRDRNKNNSCFHR